MDKIINLTGRQIRISQDFNGDEKIYPKANRVPALVIENKAAGPMSWIVYKQINLPNREEGTLFLVNPDYFELAEGREDIICYDTPDESGEFRQWCTDTNIPWTTLSRDVQNGLYRVWEETICDHFQSFRVKPQLMPNHIWQPIRSGDIVTITKKPALKFEMIAAGFTDCDKLPVGSSWFLEKFSEHAVMISDGLTTDLQRKCYIVNIEAIG